MADDAFPRYVIDHLRALGEVRCRRLFGAYGLYLGSTFFAIVHEDTLYFKTGAASQPAYVARGMEPFRPNARQTLQRYYAVPADVLDDPGELLAWALEAVRCQEGQPPRAEG